MKRLTEHSRARFLRRLAALLRRDVSLGEALTAFAQDPDPAWANAAARAQAFASEGSALASVLERSGLISDSEAGLLAASEGNGAKALALLAAELTAWARLTDAFRAAVASPLLKMGLVGIVALMIVAIQLSTLRVSLTGTTASGLLLQDPWIGATLIFVSTTAGLFTLLFGLRWMLRLRRTRRMLESAIRESVSFEGLALLESGSRFLRTLGTALEAGLPLPRAMRRTQAAFGDRVVAKELEVLCAMAEDGSSLGGCLSVAPFLDATTRWTLDHALGRPDLPGEMLALAETLQAQLTRELENMTPFLNGVANLIFAIPVLLATVGFVFGLGQWTRYILSGF
jgi:general secretion pathway protein F